MQARADDDRVGLHAHPVRELHPRPRVRLVDDAGDLGTEPDLAAGGLDLAGERAGDRGEVDDRRAGRVQGGDPGGVGLELPQARAVDHGDAGHAVGDRPLVDPLQPPELALLRGDDDLPALLVGDAALGAVGLEQPHPAAAQPRLQRPGLVVEPGVHDAAVAPGLVQRDRMLLLEHDDVRAGLLADDQPREREPEDAAADDAVPHGRSTLGGGTEVAAWRSAPRRA